MRVGVDATPQKIYIKHVLKNIYKYSALIISAGNVSTPFVLPKSLPSI
jgi:hypothetical protein